MTEQVMMPFLWPLCQHASALCLVAVHRQQPPCASTMVALWSGAILVNSEHASNLLVGQGREKAPRFLSYVWEPWQAGHGAALAVAEAAASSACCLVSNLPLLVTLKLSAWRPGGWSRRGGSSRHELVP